MNTERYGYMPKGITDYSTKAPEWTAAEHMEMNVSQRELWNYPKKVEKKKHSFWQRLF